MLVLQVPQVNLTEVQPPAWCPSRTNSEDVKKMDEEGATLETFERHRLEHTTEGAALSNDPELQRRFLDDLT